jgi:hypothetical protein
VQQGQNFNQIEISGPEYETMGKDVTGFFRSSKVHFS